MRSLFLLPLFALLAACSFPVDEFEVSNDGAAPSDAPTVDARDAAPAPTSTSTAPSSSSTPDAGGCRCIERNGDGDCKKWLPEKCGEGH